MEYEEAIRAEERARTLKAVGEWLEKHRWEKDCLDGKIVRYEGITEEEVEALKCGEIPGEVSMTEIEKMAELLNCPDRCPNNEDIPCAKCQARRLYEAGYRKVPDEPWPIVSIVHMSKAVFDRRTTLELNGHKPTPQDGRYAIAVAQRDADWKALKGEK